MSVSAYITDPSEGHRAVVTHEGYLAVGPISFNESTFLQLDSINTAFNFISPTPYRRPILDGIIINADRNVTGDATVEIYEAASPTATTAQKDLLRFDILKNSTEPVTGLGMAISSGVWVNAKTDDATINLTLIYYFVSTA